MSTFIPADGYATTRDDSVPRYKRLTRRRIGGLAIIGIFIVLIVTALLFDCHTGPSGLPVSTLLRAVFHQGPVATDIDVIVWQIRLPYAVMALLGRSARLIRRGSPDHPEQSARESVHARDIGSVRRVAGNRAEHYDPRRRASVGHLRQRVRVCAAIGFLLDTVARWRGMSTAGVVLMGISLVFSFHALVALMQFVASADALQGLVFWTLGSLVRADWPKIGVLAVALALALPMSLSNASRLTALAVSFVGIIGFVGPIAPHVARALFGEDHRFYLPGSALTGALMMSLASIASKLIIPGVLIPVGIVTALVGIPLFLDIVISSHGKLN